MDKIIWAVALGLLLFLLLLPLCLLVATGVYFRVRRNRQLPTPEGSGEPAGHDEHDRILDDSQA
jgi:hypothetical protein